MAVVRCATMIYVAARGVSKLYQPEMLLAICRSQWLRQLRWPSPRILVEAKCEEFCYLHFRKGDQEHAAEALHGGADCVCSSPVGSNSGFTSSKSSGRASHWVISLLTSADMNCCRSPFGF